MLSEMRSLEESILSIRHTLLFIDLSEAEEDIFLSMLFDAIVKKKRVEKELENHYEEIVDHHDLADLLSAWIYLTL